MTPNSDDVYWTPKTFEKLVERYVFRTKITEDFREAISVLNEYHLVNKENGLKLLKYLFEKDNEVKETYGSPEQLMKDLYIYQDFPNNAEFLGLKDSLNYHASLITFETCTGHTFCSITDAYAAFVVMLFEKYTIATILAMSIGNWIARYKKNSFDLISFNIFESFVEYETIVRSKLDFTDDFKYESIDEVFSFLSQYYDKEKDVKLLEILRKTLDDHNERRPIAKYPEDYERICSNHAYFDASIRKTFITSSCAKESFLHRKIATARLFNDKQTISPNRKFFLAKELEDALVIAMKKYNGKEFPKGLFPVETEEDRKLGILRMVKWQTYHKVLKILNLPINCVNVVVCEVEMTDRNNQVPINSPYGTYCVLAKRAFADVLAEISVGMQLFRRVNEENTPKIFEWFEKLDVFSESRKYAYCIETWKIDEIIDRAYQELQQYSTEPIYKLSKSHYGKNDVLKELLNFSPNFPHQNVLRYCYETSIKKQPIKKFCPRNVHFLYERAILFAFIDINPKYTSFLTNQGINFPDSLKDDPKINSLTEKFVNTVKF